MDYFVEYRNKLRTPDEAVKAIKSGDCVDYTTATAKPSLLDEALARGDELPEPAKREDGQITALFEWQDGCRLDAALRQTQEGWQVVRWEMTMEWTENTDMGQLWEGPA